MTIRIEQSHKQAITTRYLGATNYRGARVMARAQAGRVTISWDHALDVDANHAAAAQALADKFGWTWRMIAGALPDDSGYAFVALKREWSEREPDTQEAV